MSFNKAQYFDTAQYCINISTPCAYLPLIRVGFLTGLQCPNPSWPHILSPKA